MIRPPLSVRESSDPEALEQFQSLREGVPAGLQPTLLQFVSGALGESPSALGGQRRVKAQHRHRLSRLVDQPLTHLLNELLRMFADDDQLLLDAVDYAVHYCSMSRNQLIDLQAAFAEARSAYMVGRDADGRYELQQRQPSQLTELMNRTLSGPDETARQLATAWSKAFGRAPDWKAACDAAVAAVEAAAKPVVIPDNERATLGRIIKALEDKSEKWTTATGADQDVESVIGMLRLVWTGFTRHGGDPSPIPLTAELAQMIVHTAVLLVHWFQSGSVRRAD